MVINQGDIIILNFDPQSGHEQSGVRPALVVSNKILSKSNGMAMVCPITNTDRISPFRIPLDWRTKTKGFIQCDQARILDVFSRNPKFVEKSPKDIINKSIDIISMFIEKE
ncbi:MAG: type II toxin-antitoxin system PemK/MazF family toxin [Chitinivibrionia bacterium]|nr:type II toxin-antitoxin system PemK/MazF family toxin [Chitinivibrionia bacterium]